MEVVTKMKRREETSEKPCPETDFKSGTIFLAQIAKV